MDIKSLARELIKRLVNSNLEGVKDPDSDTLPTAPEKLKEDIGKYE